MNKKLFFTIIFSLFVSVCVFADSGNNVQKIAEKFLNSGNYIKQIDSLSKVSTYFPKSDISDIMINNKALMVEFSNTKTLVQRGQTILVFYFDDCIIYSDWHNNIIIKDKVKY